jgi:hypothetical protein
MNRVTAPGYDLLKLVVTLILAAILVILLLRGCNSAPVAPPAPEATQAASATTNPPTEIPPTATASPLPAATATLPPPTAKPSPTPELSTATPPAAPTSTPEPPPATAQAGPANLDCPGAAVSRLKVGDKVRVLNNLNQRRDPGLVGAWMITNPAGTELEIIGGPTCTAIQQQAYEWWHVRRSDGKEGWSAEASLHGQYYFLEPIP